MVHGVTQNVFIVLATRNGSRYLEAQLQSLLGQDWADWRLLARDDGSTDDTPALLANVAGRDARVEVLPAATAGDGIGAARNFCVLLQAARDRGADYVFCCDQDDVWKPGKLTQVLEQLSAAEGEQKRPCLVHHDLEVVGENGLTLSSSYWEFSALEPGSESQPQRLLSRNEVTGCALACNRALLDLALPLPRVAIMHDWWLALVAAAYGRLMPIPERLVQYRQHGENVIGAKSYRSGLKPLQNWVRVWRRGNDEFDATLGQARAFLQLLRSRPRGNSELFDAATAYVSIAEHGPIGRLKSLFRSRVWRGNPLLDVVLFMRVLMHGR